MSIRSRALLVLAVALVPSACAYLPLPRARSADVAGRSVALLAEGSAFTPSVRAATLLELEETLARPVRALDAMPVPTDADTKALAARIVGDRSAVARYDWREPQCAAERPVLAGLGQGTDAVYRAVLEYAARERPATDAEWTDIGAGRLGFRRLRQRPTVREEVLSGTIGRTAFVPRDATTRASLYRRRVTSVRDAKRIDVVVAVAEAVVGMGPIPAPDWEGLARRLLRSNCPFLALAIGDTQLVGGARRESVQTAALAAMRTNVDRRVARQRAEEATQRARAAQQEGEGADPSETPEASVASAGGASCHALCAMHMVEICNADKVLWSAHRARWESTPCGTRRDEPFLTLCYQEQWDTGTFDTSCVQPCESSEEGRTRLMAILQDAGCVPGPGPS